MSTQPAESGAYAIGDEVSTPEHEFGTIVARRPDATEPRYVVNEGNVYSDAYEAIYRESELAPLTDQEDTPSPTIPPF